MFRKVIKLFLFSRLIKSGPEIEIEIESSSRIASRMQTNLQTSQQSLSSTTTNSQSPEMMRLSKLVSQQSVCSRREAERLISLGLIRVNGVRVYENTLVPVNHQLKVFTARGVRKEIPVVKLWMMNKPRGYICTENDPENRPTVYSLLPPEFKSLGHVMSVGRLDFNTEGLLLLTNNNDVKQILQHPKSNLPRLYRVKVHGRVTQQKLSSMRKGCTINGVHYEPFKVSLMRELSTNVWMYIQVKQGKNREIRKVLQKHDLQVSKLVRLQYGPYKLGSLQLRQIKELQILPKFKREMQKRMINDITGGSKSLIQIELRPQAIALARSQQTSSPPQLQPNSSKEIPSHFPHKEIQ